MWRRPAVVFQMQAITDDTVIAYITHDDRPQYVIGAERSDVK